MNKTQTAISCYQSGDLKTALKLASGFRIGITKYQHAVLKRGYEAIVHPEFYAQLGKDAVQLIAQAKEVFAEIFLKEKV